MTKLDGQSANILGNNIEALRELFPEVCCEGKIDFDKLKQVLGDYVDDDKERYNFTWNGKGKALRLSQTPSMGTLRPCKDESKDWDTTQNLYIEGDNLEVLKLLQKSYHGKIKMIYIDPPYNTGGDFVYPDDFSDSLENYKCITGQVDDEGCKVSTNSESNGRYHTDWLNMMYPRLRLARNLLTDDGVIFISIGEDELANATKIANEVFGEANGIVQFSRVMKSGGAKGKFYTPNIDYILTFAKNIDSTKYFRTPLTDEQIERFYNRTEEAGEKKGQQYGEERLYKASLDPRPNQRYYIECPDGTFAIPPGKNFPEQIAEGLRVIPTAEDHVWKWIYERYVDEKSKGNIVFKQTTTSSLVDENGVQSKWNIYNKLWLSEQQEKGAVPPNFISQFENRQSSAELKQLDIPFDFAKPTKLITYLMGIVGVDDMDIIFDYFSGSASTADAVMQTNAKDGGNRKFICVQLPEPCTEDTEAAKAGYKNICEIGKERIRRAGEKTKAEVEAQNAQLKLSEEQKKVPDIGFKDFKLDTSNLRKWQPDYDDLEASLFDSINNYVDGRTELDVVYEIMLKMGLDLTWPVDTHSIGGKNVYTIGMGALMICLDDDITTAVVDGMVALYQDLAPETWKVVFKDNGFKDDSAKTNIHEILKCAGLDEDAFTTV